MPPYREDGMSRSFLLFGASIMVGIGIAATFLAPGTLGKTDVSTTTYSAYSTETDPDSEPRTPALFWPVCGSSGSFSSCDDCCDDATMTAAAASGVCLAGGGAGMFACMIAIGMADRACRHTCDDNYPPHPPGSGGTCGTYYSPGNCLMMCPPETHSGSGTCAPPLTCCVFND